MKKIGLYIAFLCLVVLMSCAHDMSDQIQEEQQGISLLLMPSVNYTRAVDDDNLTSEQIINNLSIFLTEPSSTVIVDKYIHYNFTTIDATCKLVNLPLDPATVGEKDIYVIANHDDVRALNSYTTVANLQNLMTPSINTNSMLMPENGFCMYGVTSGYDFSTQGNTRAKVSLIRTCAKYRIKLTFSDASYSSTENSFNIRNIAMYTPVGPGATITTPSDAYYDYPNNIPLPETSAGVYSNIIYIYESAQVPTMAIEAVLNGETETFLVRLPLPQRNYLYDIEVEINPAVASTRSFSEHW